MAGFVVAVQSLRSVNVPWRNTDCTPSGEQPVFVVKPTVGLAMCRNKFYCTIIKASSGMPVEASDFGSNHNFYIINHN